MYAISRSRPCSRRSLAVGFRSIASAACQDVTSAVASEPGSSMPPGFTATVGQFQTFVLPHRVSRCQGHIEMGMDMINAWRRDGLIQVAMTETQQKKYQAADIRSRKFFAQSPAEKAKCVDKDSYSGYIASGEEITNGIADYSEIFTVTKDLPKDDYRTASKWPCHGPCPWPDEGMKNDIGKFTSVLGEHGDKILQLIELGLDAPEGSLTKLVEDGWHHMRVLRFPAQNNTNGKGKAGRGIGSHTDYGLLVIAAQDDVGGLFIRPPHRDENFANWSESTAGLKEEDAGWSYVPPMPGVFTVFPGDMMQYLTGSFLPSTPHKVGLNTRERFAFAYFHEPNFRSVIRPLASYGNPDEEGIHYGTHFTNMFLRNYPDRITTATMVAEDRYKLLKTPALRAD